MIAGLVYLVPNPDADHAYTPKGLLPTAIDTATALPDELKVTAIPCEVGKVAGLAYLVPKPLADQGYAVTKGVVACATAIELSTGLKLIPSPLPAGRVAGLAYLVPKPLADQGYAVTKGVVEFATAMQELSGLNATSAPPPKSVPFGKVLGLEYIAPNPEFDHGYALTNGVAPCVDAMKLPFGLKATSLTPFCEVAGFVYRVPNPVLDDHRIARIGFVPPIAITSCARDTDLLVNSMWWKPAIKSILRPKLQIHLGSHTAV
jgi:hypothetical protein